MGKTLKARESESLTATAETQGLEELSRLVTELQEEEALAAAQQLLAGGTPPLDVLAACQKGMRAVGALHEEGRYFMSALIMAGEIMREVLERIRPKPPFDRLPEGRGRILLGTIAGDIHDIGKDLLRDLLQCNGLTVLDLGVDVPPEEFLKAAEEFRPDVVAVSALITESFPRVRELVSLFEERAREGGRKPPILLGGGQVDALICKATGADLWSPDAFDGLRMCLELLGAEKGG